MRSRHNRMSLERGTDLIATLELRLALNTTKRTKAEKLTEQVLGLIYTPVILNHTELVDDIPQYYESSLSVKLEAVSNPDAVSEVLRLLKPVSRVWNIDTSDLDEPGKVMQLKGTAAALRLPGVEDVEFLLHAKPEPDRVLLVQSV